MMCLKALGLWAVLLCLLANVAVADVTIRNFDGSGSTARIDQVARMDVSGDKLRTGDEGIILQYPGDPKFYFYTPDFSPGVLVGYNSGFFGGFAVYTTTDFKQWTPAGTGGDGLHLFTPDATWQTLCLGGFGHSSCWLPHPVFNSILGEYVVWFTNTTKSSTVQCDTPTGGCGAPVQTANCGPAGHNISGGNPFIDDDGTGYLVMTDLSTGPFQTLIQQLNVLYTDCVGSITTVNSDGGEAVSLMKRGSTYYVVQGNPNCPYCISGVGTYYYTASGPLATWSSGTRIDSGTNTCLGQHANTNHLVIGGNDVYLLTAQQWDPGNAGTDGSSNQSLSNLFWMPLTFSGTAINAFTCDATFTLSGVMPSPVPDLRGTDQTDENAPANALCDIAGNKRRAQTFIPGKNYRIQQLWLPLAQGNQDCTLDGCASARGVNADLTVQLTNVGGGVPGSVIATMTVPAATELWSPTRHKLNVPGTPSLQTGTTYAIVLSSPSATIGCWTSMYGNQNPYPSGGEIVSTNGGTTWTPVANTSLLFSTVPLVRPDVRGVASVMLMSLHILLWVLGGLTASGSTAMAAQRVIAMWRAPTASETQKLEHRPEAPFEVTREPERDPEEAKK